MAEVVRVLLGPVWPETGSIARVVELDDGSGLVQTYSPLEKQWKDGGLGLYSAMMGDRVDRKTLEQMDYDEEDIENILWWPEGQEAE